MNVTARILTGGVSTGVGQQEGFHRLSVAWLLTSSLNEN